MSWKIKTFEELSKRELYTIMKERVNVFIVEQDCPYPELDNKDEFAFHLFHERDGEIIAYSRIFKGGDYYEEASFGRVIVKMEYRKEGLGRDLLERAIAFIHDELKERSIKIQAQDYLRNFYGSFGFKPITDVYLEDGIPHLDMLYIKQ
ncbi:GNAT family N-acetyltransferase [Evansella sp. AB-P1]|uniref:GNAT family N-acetyltransferase n=1 Tax=Evansella sp. AB-P1 TaxID=3037653 RepID=UPI00241F9259|nr:GNAT family N-acetyltransferase [Evansella sp. AB-P1]MDG5786068.1 GNAT family N-acetyltransferase [Evansella sp. AB-P1]